MTRLFALLIAFVALPAGLAATALLPPLVGPTGMLVASALLLAALAGGALFHRLSVALLVGAAAGGVAAFCNAHLALPGTVDALTGGAALVAAGAGGGFVAHALGLALAGTRVFAQGYRPARAGSMRNSARNSSTPVWAPLTHFVHARHPARLKPAYCRFHVAVTWCFAVAWFALLGGLVWYGRTHTALGPADLNTLSATALGGALLAGGVLLAASAVVTWWLVALVLTRATVAAGVLPPFGIQAYVRHGQFPSHWIAHEPIALDDEAWQLDPTH